MQPEKHRDRRADALRSTFPPTPGRDEIREVFIEAMGITTEL
jgi:hypothetical protein